MSSPVVKQKIAVIGSGIAGLTSAYLLRNDYSVTVFEREASLGMSAHGFTIKENGKEYTIDFPHRVVNLRYYTHLASLFAHLDIKLNKEDYSLSVSNASTRESFFGWKNIWFTPGKSLPFFNWKTLLSSPRVYLRMVIDALYFFSQGRQDVASGFCNDKTTGEYFEYLMKQKGFSKFFIDDCILAALAVVGTCTYDSIRSMPADVTVAYITTGNFSLTDKNSGVRRPEGGVPSVVRALSAPLTDIRVSSEIESIYKDGEKIVVQVTGGKKDTFDHIIFATQANQALKMLREPSDLQKQCLGAFRHEKTRLVLHTDDRVMPRAESEWTAFHIMLDSAKEFPMASLWMNRNRRDFDPQMINVFQTVNPIIQIPKDRILHEYTFERPIIDMQAVKAINMLDQINGKNGIWFSGAYSTYGMPLLESAVVSAFTIAEKLGAKSPLLQRKKQPSRAAPSSPLLLSKLLVAFLACVFGLVIFLR